MSGMNRRGPRISQAELGQVQRRQPRVRPAARRRSGLIPLVAILLVAAFVGGGVGAWLHARHGVSLGDARRPATSVIVFVVDGLQPTDVNSGSMPHLRSLARSGVTYPSAWIGQLEGDTLSSSATLGTGAFPRSDGVVGAAWRDPKSGQIVRPANVAQAVLGNLDGIMESHAVTPVAAVVKDADPQSRILAVGGSDCSIPNAEGTWLADYILCFARDGRNWVPTAVAGHELPANFRRLSSFIVSAAAGGGFAPQIEGWRLGSQDASVARYAISAISAVHPRVAYVDFPEYGALMPYALPSEAPRIRRTLLRGIDADIGLIISRLRHLRGPDRPVFVVTSNEALATIDRTVTTGAIADAVITAGGEQTYVGGSELAAIGLLDPLQGAPVAQDLETQHLPAVDGIFFKSKVGGRWQYQLQYLNPLLSGPVADAADYLTSTLACPESPEVLMDYAPGTGLTGPTVHSFRSTDVNGGLQWDTQHLPLIIAGQGVPPGHRSSFPARLVDIAPTIEALLGLHPGNGNGVALSDSLLYPTQQELEAQSSVSGQLTPLVRALRNRLSE